MDPRLALIAMILLAPFQALGQSSPPPGLAAGLCRTAIAAVERSTGVPDRLMQSMGVMESGRRDAAGVAAAWPWTINVEGAGEVFDTKAAAIAAVLAHQARGARSIDVGCLQINLMHHPDAFASLDEAFDPAANARYAARFLQQLLGTTGSWPRAVAGYHSMTPDIGADYARKVLAIWARPDLAPTAAQPPGTQIAGATQAGGGAGPALPGGRIMPTASSGGPAFTGRDLSSYRALPSRPGLSGIFKRF
jgi:hypothetical protein